MNQAKVKLIGGPLDGKLVEFAGTRYASKILDRRGFFFDAIYSWCYDKNNPSVIVGKFHGYFRSYRRVRKDGTKMPKKRK